MCGFVTIFPLTKLVEYNKALDLFVAFINETKPKECGGTGKFY